MTQEVVGRRLDAPYDRRNLAAMTTTSSSNGLAVRTPDERFADIPDFPYPPRYLEDLPGFPGLRAAVIDEGPKDAAHTFLCLHGEPTWSFLYRKMIPTFLASGARVVAPDFFGFGRSDKPVDDARYTFAFHRDYLLRVIEALDLQHVTLVVQDWGGLLGLTLPVDRGARARIERLLVMNTDFAVGEALNEGFAAWRSYVAANPDFAAGKLIRRGKPDLTEREVAAYDAPFPDATYKAGVRRFPQLVMTEPRMEGVAESKEALAYWSKDFRGKTFMAYGARDPVFNPAKMETLRAKLPGCPPALVIAEGGHFVQEWGQAIAQAALASFGD
jgi:haloalkane dehalogenase